MLLILLDEHLIVDLEWAVAVVSAAHVVKPPDENDIDGDGDDVDDDHDVVVKGINQPFLCAALAAMASTKQTHHLDVTFIVVYDNAALYVDVEEAHRVGRLRILDILATVVGRLVELVAHKVGHFLHL